MRGFALSLIETGVGFGLGGRPGSLGGRFTPDNLCGGLIPPLGRGCRIFPLGMGGIPFNLYVGRGGEGRTPYLA